MIDFGATETPASFNEFELGMCLYVLMDWFDQFPFDLPNEFTEQVNTNLSAWLAKYGDILKANGKLLE